MASSHASHTGLRACVQICTTHIKHSGVDGVHLQIQCLGKGRVLQPTGELQVQQQTLHQKQGGDRLRTSRHLMLTHDLPAHTHMHMNTYVHHVHINIWRGYKKNLTEIGILWHNRNHICLTTSPEGGHLPRAYVTRVGQGQSRGASRYPLRCYRELFSAMAHSQVLRKDLLMYFQSITQIYQLQQLRH